MKPGKCPNVDAKSLECPDNVASICLSDGDCDATEKCCSDGCSLKCTAPVIEGAKEPQRIKGEIGEKGARGEKVELVLIGLSHTYGLEHLSLVF